MVTFRNNIGALFAIVPVLQGRQKQAHIKTRGALECIGAFQGSKEENKKPSVPKCLEGLRKSSEKLYSSLAVFYVEQVALNRHVKCDRNSDRLAATAASIFMLEKEGVVKSKHAKARDGEKR
jgi:hypothetical protein